MVKKVEEYFLQHNFTVKGKYAYGEFDSFETNVLMEPTAQFPLLVHFTCFLTDTQKQAVSNLLGMEKLKNCRFEWTLYGFSVYANDLTVKRLVDRLDELLNKVCDILKNNGALGARYCPICGNALSEDIKKCTIDGLTITLDNTCVQDINTAIEESNKQFDEAPNNYLRGFAGAVLGGLVGVVLSVILYVVGFISALSAFVAFFLGTFLYGKFGGKQNKVMIAIVSVTTILLMVGTTFAIYLVVAGAAASEAGLNISAFEAFGLIMEDEEVARSFIADMVMTVLFCALGCGYEIFSMFKKVKRTEKI